MTLNLAVGPVVSLIAGILILLVPRLLNYIVAIYLIAIGLIGILGWNGTHIRSTAIENGVPASASVIYTSTAPAPGVIVRRSSVVAGRADDS